MEPLPCPFCGHIPIVRSLRPDDAGNSWGFVRCGNPKCSARPIVLDDEEVSDNIGSDLYKIAAIKRWNKRF